MALCPGLPGWASTRKVKPIWILLKQKTVNGSGISWAICKSASRSRQITTPAPHHSVFTGRMSFLPPNQQRQSTEGIPRQHGALQILYCIASTSGLIFSSPPDCRGKGLPLYQPSDASALKYTYDNKIYNAVATKVIVSQLGTVHTDNM